MSAGKILVWVGAALIVAGLIVSYMPGLLSWFGRLPGDLRIEHGDRRVFIPITSMIVVSVVLSILLNLLFRR